MQVVFDRPIPEHKIFVQEEPLAIRNEDWPAINKAIADAIAPLRPRGWRKALFFLREWGILSGIFTGIIALLALAAGAFYQATARIKDETIFQTKTEGRLTEIEKGLSDIKKSMDLAELKKLIDSPITIESAKKIATLVDVARTPDARLDQKIVSAVGAKLISDGKGDQQSWMAALSLVGYKSFLNDDSSRSVLPSPVGDLKTKYFVVSPKGAKPPTFGVAGIAPTDKAAQMYAISQGDLNQTWGNQYIFVSNGGLSLDGMRLKNVVLTNVYVAYDGGPISLENVYFVNCTFGILQQTRGQDFALAILNGAPATNFKVSWPPTSSAR